MKLGNGVVATAVLALCATADAAEPSVTVGSTRYATSVVDRSGGKPVRLVLTGAAMRTKYTFKVYSVASYLQEGVTYRTPEALASAPALKKLCLTFERSVASADLAASFRESVAMNHPSPAFSTELDTLSAYFQAHPVARGNAIWLTSTPSGGLLCQLTGAPPLTLPNDAFARAVWEIYLGRNNLGVAIQEGLTSRR